MDLCILGSGVAIPQAHRGPTGIWATTGKTSLLIDCGAGTSQRFVGAGGDLCTLDAVFLSHAHLDHMGDLPSLLFALALPEVGRSADLRIVGSPRLKPIIDQLRGIYGRWLEPEHFAIVWSLLEAGDALHVGSFAVRAFAVAHHDTSIGFRLTSDDGATVAIPADTEFCESLVAAARDVDCLVIECSATDKAPRKGHMAPKDVLQLVSRAEPRTVVVTHQYPDAEAAGVVDQIRAQAPCPVFEAVDGFKLTVRPGEGAKVSTSDTARILPEPAPGFFEDLSEVEIHTLMEADLARLDADVMLERKFRGGVEETTRKVRQVSSPSRRRSWSEGDLHGLRPNRRQKQLLSRAKSDSSVPEVNLRRSHAEDAEKRLKASIETWRTSGFTEGLVITGKGKHSEGSPVLKLMVLNWLDGPEGVVSVSDWAPVLSADGDFGSVVVRLRW